MSFHQPGVSPGRKRGVHAKAQGQAVCDSQVDGLGGVPAGCGQQGCPRSGWGGVKQFEADLRDNLYKIWNRMSSGSSVSAPGHGGGDPQPAHTAGAQCSCVPHHWTTCSERGGDESGAAVQQVSHPCHSYAAAQKSADERWACRWCGGSLTAGSTPTSRSSFMRGALLGIHVVKDESESPAGLGRRRETGWQLAAPAGQARPSGLWKPAGVWDQGGTVVECSVRPVVAQADRGEDAVAVAADGSAEADERFEAAAGQAAEQPIDETSTSSGLRPGSKIPRAASLSS